MNAKRRRNTAKAVSTNAGVLENEAKAVRQNLAGSLAQKSGKSYVCRNFKLHEVKDEHCNCQSHTSMLCIRGLRIPTMIRMSQHSKWEDGAGLSLFYHSADHEHLKIEPMVSLEKKRIEQPR